MELQVFWSNRVNDFIFNRMWYGEISLDVLANMRFELLSATTTVNCTQI